MLAKYIVLSKIVILTLLLILLCASVQPQEQYIDLNRSYKSVEVLSDSCVVFRIYAPAAKSVTIKSPDFWESIDFKKDDNGIWEGIGCDFHKGAFRYSFVVDGLLVNDPILQKQNQNIPVFLLSSGNEFFEKKRECSSWCHRPTILLFPYFKKNTENACVDTTWF